MTLNQIFNQRQDVLIRCSAGINDVGGTLEALVVRRIPQQRVVLLEQRDDFLADDDV